jgi:hypothetical protein
MKAFEHDRERTNFIVSLTRSATARVRNQAGDYFADPIVGSGYKSEVRPCACGRSLCAIGEFTDLQLKAFGWRIRFTASMRRLLTVRTRIVRLGFRRLPLHCLP